MLCNGCLKHKLEIWRVDFIVSLLVYLWCVGPVPGLTSKLFYSCLQMIISGRRPPLIMSAYGWALVGTNIIHVQKAELSPSGMGIANST